MVNMNTSGAALAAFLTVMTASVSAEESYRDASPVINEYFELVFSGNYDIAGDMWTPEALERSGRFGIRFTGIPIKADCNSPLMRNLDVLASKGVAPIRKYETLGDKQEWYQVEYADVFGSALLKHNYYLQRRGDWFWLGYSQDFYSTGWPVVESRYLRIRTHPAMQKYLNSIGLAEADRFVEQMANRLNMTDKMLASIGTTKIEYFFCPTDSAVQQMSGFLVKGTLDLASNDIISADFPHFHEMTHLLVNIRLQELPLYTLPFVREGLAVYLAGRWGKHPAPLMDLAVFLYEQELIVFDSILTMSGFEAESGADIVYPVAGLFTSYLVEKMGMPKFLDLYLRLSGKFPEVDGLSVNDVQTAFTKAAGRISWDDLKTDFVNYLKRHKEKDVVALPGVGKQGKKIIDDTRFTVFDDGDWLAFEFVAAPGDTLCQGNLVFGPIDSLKGQVSSLFESQYHDGTLVDGYRFGVRYDQNEAGLYDYVTNQLVAKYIWGITPSDDYFNAEQKKIAVRFRKSLLNGLLPEKGQCRLLPM
jgi:hypothetical protein